VMRGTGRGCECWLYLAVLVCSVHEGKVRAMGNVRVKAKGFSCVDRGRVHRDRVNATGFSIMVRGRVRGRVGVRVRIRVD